MAVRRRTAKEFHFDIARTRAGIRLKPASAAQAASLDAMSFAEGTALFRAVVGRMTGRRGMIDPETVDWPPLPDPLGILKGNQTLPWKLLNPAAKKCLRCTPKGGDGGVDCVEVPCDDVPRS